jgi:hypothetical protein
MVISLQFHTVRAKIFVELVNPSDSRSVSYLISHFERHSIYSAVKMRPNNSLHKKVTRHIW